jgi:hypothetical protein
MGISEKLMKIQTKIKAPKNLKNTFGNYKYRNAEGIFEAVKPYLEKENCSLVVKDEIEQHGDRYYVKAMAILIDNETGEEATATAFAREAETKKGMDDSQITGTASSYARKYALNGLFLLDDTKDADTDEHRKEAEARSEETKATEKQEKDEQHYEEVGKMKIAQIKVDSLKDKCKNDGVDIEKVCEFCKVKKPEELTENQFSNIINHWNDVLEKCK